MVGALGMGEFGRDQDDGRDGNGSGALPVIEHAAGVWDCADPGDAGCGGEGRDRGGWIGQQRHGAHDWRGTHGDAAAAGEPGCFGVFGAGSIDTGYQGQRLGAWAG